MNGYKKVTPIFCTSRYRIIGSIYAFSINEEYFFTSIINQNVLFIFRESESASYCYSGYAVCQGCNVFMDCSNISYSVIIIVLYIASSLSLAIKLQMYNCNIRYVVLDPTDFNRLHKLKGEQAAILNIWRAEGVFDRRAVITWLELRGGMPRYRPGCIVGTAPWRGSSTAFKCFIKCTACQIHTYSVRGLTVRNTCF